jgi:hypothetical protein
MVGEALSAWGKKGYKDGTYYWGMDLRGEINVDVNSGLTSLEHLIGSAAVKISHVNKDEIIVEIFNVTSLTSGDFNKDAPIVKWFTDPLKPTVRNPGEGVQRDHSNISQHFSFTMSTSEAQKIINRFNPPGNIGNPIK